MKEHLIPKWQREIRSFLGIKSGLILEGNVYDEFPQFDLSGPEPVFLGTDNLEQTLLGLADPEQAEVFFFDPVDGFYCCNLPPEEQREKLKSLIGDTAVIETTVNHGQTVCIMPRSGGGAMGGSSNDPDKSKHVQVSRIIRNAITYGLPAFANDQGEPRSLIFVMNFASRLEACNLYQAESNTMFMNLMAGMIATQNSRLNCNTLIMVVDKYNDIPAWVYMNNPNLRTISVGSPDRGLRRLYLENLQGDLRAYSILADEAHEAGKRFVAETEGMRLQELAQVLRLARSQQLPPSDIELAFRMYRYGVSDNPWENLENDILTHIEKNLEKRVKGQHEALDKVKTVVTRAVKGLSGLQHSEHTHKPKGIMFFAGPTGVGKTETAKALAESIFRDENACIRFDMSEYRLEQSDQKLFGAPPGYVGYEGGGQLTNAVKNRPFSLLLFDEIEKASPTILDKFLQILEDGRMTDNQGNTVYFGETIIIFTSNIGMTKEATETVQTPYGPREIPDGHHHRVPTITIDDPEQEDTPQFQEHVRETVTEGVKAYFNDIGRPELLNRLGENNIVVFQFINKAGAESICRHKLSDICENVKKSTGIEIIYDAAEAELCSKAVLERANGGRGVGNMLEREFQNPLAMYLCTLSQKPKKVRCIVGAEGRIKFEEVLEEA